MVEVVGHVFISFYFSDSSIVSRSSFACNWQTRFLDSEPVVTHFLSNTCGISDIRIPCNSAELHPIPCMRVVCHAHRLGLSCMSKQNILSLILLILLVELTNKKKGIYRYCILYPLRLRPSFPNDIRIIKPKVFLGPN